MNPLEGFGRRYASRHAGQHRGFREIPIQKTIQPFLRVDAACQRSIYPDADIGHIGSLGEYPGITSRGDVQAEMARDEVRINLQATQQHLVAAFQIPGSEPGAHSRPTTEPDRVQDCSVQQHCGSRMGIRKEDPYAQCENADDDHRGVETIK